MEESERNKTAQNSLQTKPTRTSCCLESKLLSYSPFARSPTSTLSGTTYVRSFRWRFRLVKFPTYKEGGRRGVSMRCWVRRRRE